MVGKEPYIIVGRCVTTIQKMKSNPIRITLPDSHTPMSAPLEDKYYIKQEDIILAIKNSLK